MVCTLCFLDLLWPWHPFLLSSPITGASSLCFFFSSCTLKVTGDQSALYLEMQSWQTGFAVVCLAKMLGSLPEGFTLSKRTWLFWSQSGCEPWKHIAVFHVCTDTKHLTCHFNETFKCRVKLRLLGRWLSVKGGRGMPKQTNEIQRWPFMRTWIQGSGGNQQQV